MKLIKKIAAIMFAFMMVVSMSCNVKAVEGASPETKGTITITNAKEGETYKLYKILSLESYSYTENDKDNGNYAYKLTSDGWDSFIKGAGVLNEYFEFDDTNSYLTWKGDKSPARVKEFAQLALKYARNKTNNVQPVQPVKKAASDTVTYSGLDLGYYLVDSSVGSLCVLNTTNPDLTIAEKNGVPSVEKGVSNTQKGTYGTSNNASIGDTVYFKTTITAQPGAQNYVLHDKMTDGLTFNNTVEVKKGGSTVESSNYTLQTTELTDGCTFEIEFKQNFCDTLIANDIITVTYSATLNENAVIAGEGNKNETKLKYGDSQETQPSVTNTKTFKMDVFKFYKDKNDSTTEKGLAGAIFKLTKGSQDAENIGFVKTSNETATDDVYRVAKKGETGTVTTITSPKSGKFTIQGLGAGTYYLTETQQPDGYNKLSGPVTVVIDENGKVMVKKGANLEDATEVKVENKTGTVLPSTGGSGTTMIYLIGAVLVLGSGVVLATKRRVKNK
jgi:fimbrial isopeptide formation D2 family protein/LPXTG-motif cell wall-anchored protein